MNVRDLPGNGTHMRGSGPADSRAGLRPDLGVLELLGGWQVDLQRPYLPEIKLSEMPILGFGGFPPFALECFVMYVAVRRWLWTSARRPVGL